MILLDAYAVLAYLTGERAMDEVGDLLQRGEPIGITGIGRAEVIDRLTRTRGIDPDALRADLAVLNISTTVPVDAQIGETAGVIRSSVYDRRLCAVSMADCCLLAAALHHDAALATSDPHLLDAAQTVGVATVALPDSSGKRWQPH